MDEAQAKVRSWTRAQAKVRSWTVHSKGKIMGGAQAQVRSWTEHRQR